MPRAWIVVMGFVLAGLGALGAYFLPVFQTAASAVGSSGLTNLNSVNPPTQALTVRLLGSDDDSKFPPERLNTQSMILMRIDPTTKQAGMLSIPRDLWVPIPNSDYGKISTAYQLGGAQGAIASVESNFKVHIDDYVWIGLNGLVHVIDKLGGVNVLVTNPVIDDFYPADVQPGGNPYEYYRVAVLPGATNMDGVHALQYVRSRHRDARRDFARSERQRQLLLAIKAQARHLNIADLPALGTAMNGEVKTSIDIDRLRALMSIANAFNGSNIRRVVLVPPYTSERCADGQSVVLPDWNQILPLVHKRFPLMRRTIGTGLVLMMLASGIGVYLYLLTTGGRQVAQRTHNSSQSSVEGNHWSFYPRLSPDGATLFYDYDPKSRFNEFQLDLAIFASPSNSDSRVSVKWTHPNSYTGGDVNPVPLREGGLVYTKYSNDESFHVHSQVWIQKRPGAAGQALTAPELDCAQPALAADEKQMAMVCTKGSNQAADLLVAVFGPAALTVGSPMALVSGHLVAAPVFSPDGKTIAYLVPSKPGGHFQLWTVGAAARSSIRNITTDLGLDSTSPPVWTGG